MTMEKEKTAITEKYTMTVPEASAYFGIGQKKLRRLCENHTIDSFAVYSGNRYLIIRTKFEEFLQQASEI
jgi:excisionase family DNA binding protein